MTLSEYKLKLKAAIDARDASPFVPKEKWIFADSSTSIDCPECGEEVESPGYVIESTDEHQAVDIHLYGMEKICRPQAEFIVLAANNFKQICESQLKLIESMWLAKIRLGILTDRMRACGQHELLEEAEMFVSEAQEALDDLVKGQG